MSDLEIRMKCLELATTIVKGADHEAVLRIAALLYAFATSREGAGS